MRFTWEKLRSFFPSLTHLSLLGLFIPRPSHIELQPNTLVKLDLGGAGPPLHIKILSTLLGQHMSTLRHVRFGTLSPMPSGDNLVPTFWALAQCEKLQSLEIELHERGHEAEWMKDWVDWMYLDVMRGGKCSERETFETERQGQPPRLKVRASASGFWDLRDERADVFV